MFLTPRSPESLRSTGLRPSPTTSSKTPQASSSSGTSDTERPQNAATDRRSPQVSGWSPVRLAGVYPNQTEGAPIGSASTRTSIGSGDNTVTSTFFVSSAGLKVFQREPTAFPS